MQQTMNQERYQRQISLKGFGEQAQQKLAAARVLVAGAGGLSCPALLYLAAAGVGNIGIADYDFIELSNLQRQTLYTISDVGKAKAEIAAERLRQYNPDLNYEVHNTRLGTDNALEIIGQYDLVVDGTDNFETRYLINDACVILDKPLVYGAVLRFEGQVGVLNMPDDKDGPKASYRDVFAEPPSAGSIASCTDAGVLGVVPGIIGSMQAAEAIKIITGIGNPLCNRILCVNVQHNTFYEIQISPTTKKDIAAPRSEAEFKSFDYRLFCANGEMHNEISPESFNDFIRKENTIIIDVRKPGEQGMNNEFAGINIPLDELEARVDEIPAEKNIILVCRSGQRSRMAATILQKHLPSVNISSLRGGLLRWYELRHSNEVKHAYRNGKV